MEICDYFWKSPLNAVIWIRKKVNQISPLSSCISYFIEVFPRMVALFVHGTFWFGIRTLSFKFLWHFQSRNLQVCLLFIGVSGKALTQVWLCLLDYDNSVNCQGLLWNKFFKGNLVFWKYSNLVLSLCFHRFLIASSSYGPWNRFLKSIQVESNR